MSRVVAFPGAQVFPEALLELKITDWPAQNVVGPFAVIVGTVGSGFTVTITGLETATQPPLVTVTI